MVRKSRRRILLAFCLCFSVIFGTGTRAMADFPVEETSETAAVQEEGAKVVNFNTKGAAVTNFIMEGNGDMGYLWGGCAADAAYLGMVGDQVRFMISGVIGLVNKSDVEVLDLATVSTLSSYTVSDGRLIHSISTDVRGSGPAFSMDNGPAPSCLEEGRKYYGYDGHYFYTTENYAAMISDYQNRTRAHAVNPDAPYYNYFQYLPLRSVTSYTGDELSAMIRASSSAYGETLMTNLGGTFVQEQNRYGVNALLMAGVSANESGWGTSWIAKNKNNLFGLNAVDTSPGESADTFESVEACVKEYADIWMSKGYLNPSDWRYYGGFFGNKASGMNVKYASDPYWGEKAAGVVWGLDRKGGEKDRDKYVIGIKGGVGQPENLPVNVRAESTTESGVLYQTSECQDVAVLILDSDPQNNFYRIQSDPVLKADRSGIDAGTGEYNFDAMYGYISADYVRIVSSAGGWPFPDVYNDWYYDAVEYVYQKGIMTGMNKWQFGTTETLSRAQFATSLYRMAQAGEVPYIARFPDVPDGQFYTQPVLWASSLGVDIIRGYDEGYFGPGNPVTREEVAVMLFRYAKYKGYQLPAGADLSAFPDVMDVTYYAVDAISWAVADGIIQGDGDKLNPQGGANRAACAVMLRRFMEKYQP